MHTTLITAEELARHIDDPDWVVVDCRFDLANPLAGREGYRIGHIRNAVYADLERQLSGDKHAVDGTFRGRHPLPGREFLAEVMRELGISEHTQVVAYDAHGGMYAARLWWLLRWIGHPQVAVLDGGMAAWQALGLPMESTVREPHTGNLQQKPSLVGAVTAADVLENIATGARTVVDARAPDRFRGENETIDPVGGHIPGAKNRFFKDNLHADGRFKDAAALRADFEKVVPDPKLAIMQCGSGVTACHNLLAMEVAGLHGAALYPGSWSEWSSDPARPIATGAE
ncbi:sulfurtransferase [Pseudoduganella sp. GCM10020061]|uniref:sulfurtransferase n=1 Tax=Pseudoduganella sp. GCM10020061 TaxID=3317345 RepID=UPI0036327622